MRVQGLSVEDFGLRDTYEIRIDCGESWVFVHRTIPRAIDNLDTRTQADIQLPMNIQVL